MQIGRLSKADLDAHRRLMLEAYALHPDAFTSSAQERAALPMSWWAGGACWNRPRVVLGARVDDEVCGVAGMSFSSRSKTRHKAKLFGMYVPVQHRGGDAGRALLRAALLAARNRGGIELVQLSVTQGNVAAERLYSEHGFEVFGCEPLAVAVADAYVSKLHRWCKL
jgi:RimJ/RimL family protein N-acetyltransferase